MSFPLSTKEGDEAPARRQNNLPYRHIMIYNNILDKIGNTPLVRINHFTLPKKVAVYAKLESYNPGG